MKRTISLRRQRKHDNSKSSLDCRECGDEIRFIRHIKNKSKIKHRVICRYGHNYISQLGGCHLGMNFQRRSVMQWKYEKAYCKQHFELQEQQNLKQNKNYLHIFHILLGSKDNSFFIIIIFSSLKSLYSLALDKR